MLTIEAVLFDLHGVLTSSPWASLAQVGTGGGASPEAVLELMLGDYATDGDHPWHRLERGEIGLGEYLPQVVAAAAEAGIPLDFEKMRGFNERIVVNQPMIDRVAELRTEGYRTALVTNNIREVASGWRALFDLDALFDVVVDSSEVGARKPNPRIYAIALELLGVAPAAAVFLDDAPGNVAGAQAAGLHAILVDEDPVSALSELDRLLAST